MKKFLFIILLLFSAAYIFSQSVNKSENLILITIDGCRWQEVFDGADSMILFNDEFKKSEARRLTNKFWANSKEERRNKLMPFLWNVIAQEGRIYGNRVFIIRNT